MKNKSTLLIKIFLCLLINGCVPKYGFSVKKTLLTVTTRENQHQKFYYIIEASHVEKYIAENYTNEKIVKISKTDCSFQNLLTDKGKELETHDTPIKLLLQTIAIVYRCKDFFSFTYIELTKVNLMDFFKILSLGISADLLIWPQGPVSTTYKMFEFLGIIIGFILYFSNKESKIHNINSWTLLILTMFFWIFLIFLHNKYVRISYLEDTVDSVIIYPVFMSDTVSEIYRVDSTGERLVPDEEIQDAICATNSFFYSIIWISYVLFGLLVIMSFLSSTVLFLKISILTKSYFHK